MKYIILRKKNTVIFYIQTRNLKVMSKNKGRIELKLPFFKGRFIYLCVLSIELEIVFLTSVLFDLWKYYTDTNWLLVGLFKVGTLDWKCRAEKFNLMEANYVATVADFEIIRIFKGKSNLKNKQLLMYNVHTIDHSITTSPH